MNVHEKLRRIKGKMSVPQFAEKIGLEKHLVEDWLKSTKPKLDQAVAIADALAIPLDYLARDEMETIPVAPEPPKRSVWRSGIEQAIDEFGEEKILAAILAYTTESRSRDSARFPSSVAGKADRRDRKDPSGK